MFSVYCELAKTVDDDMFIVSERFLYCLKDGDNKFASLIGEDYFPFFFVELLNELNDGLITHLSPVIISMPFHLYTSRARYRRVSLSNCDVGNV